jgi:hypothetical protein
VKPDTGKGKEQEKKQDLLEYKGVKVGTINCTGVKK